MQKELETIAIVSTLTKWSFRSSTPLAKILAAYKDGMSKKYSA